MIADAKIEAMAEHADAAPDHSFDDVTCLPVIPDPCISGALA